MGAAKLEHEMQNITDEQLFQLESHARRLQMRRLRQDGRKEFTKSFATVKPETFASSAKALSNRS